MKVIGLIYLLLMPFMGLAQAYQLPNEQVLFKLRTTDNHLLVVALDSTEDYLVYRYGTAENIELRFPDDLSASWDLFRYSWYLRGGGMENEGMELDYLYFDRGQYRYVVFQEYYARSEEISSGIKVIDRLTDKRTTIDAHPDSVEGTLLSIRFLERIQEGDEFFEAR